MVLGHNLAGSPVLAASWNIVRRRYRLGRHESCMVGAPLMQSAAAAGAGRDAEGADDDDLTYIHELTHAALAGPPSITFTDF